MNRGANNTYLGNISESIKSLLLGLKLSIRHFFEAKNSRKPYGIHEKEYFEQKTGIFTLQYPKESIPVPDNGRYRLYNEIEDCIVCDKCAKICPVDCIDIEPIKAVAEIGKTSDGTPKRLYAAKFDIDMGKCCFCGLCTTVCPTECLTMTKSYDFSEFDVADHVYAFSEMTPLEILEKKQEIEKVNQEKELAKAAKAENTLNEAKVPGEKTEDKSLGAKPSFKPRVPIKPKTATESAEKEPAEEAKNQALELMKAKAKMAEESKDDENAAPKSAEKASKPVFKPRIPVKPKSSAKPIKTDAEIEAEKNTSKDPSSKSEPLNEENPKHVKPVFKPKIPVKPKTTGNPEEQAKDLPPGASSNISNTNVNAENIDTEKETPKPKPRPVFKPRIPINKNKGDKDKNE